MGSLKAFTRQAKRMAAVVALLLSTVAPTLVPSLVAADQVTERSIELSSSSKGASNVTYTVNFTPAKDAAAFVVDFCSDSPVVNQPCGTPTGFNASAAASTSTGFTDVTGSATQVIVTGTMQSGTPVSVALTGINNPTNPGPLYARIVTFDSQAGATAYTSENAGTYQDEGGVAMSITDTFGVSGAVLESMTFCAADVTITADCANVDSSNAPVLKLGQTVGSTVALDASHVSTGDVYTQVSTNAVGGATINLKSDVACGGLKRPEASGCDIAPAVTGGISAGDAKFGLTAAAAADTGTNPNGTFQAINGYSDSTYHLNWVSGNATGVGSAYGDPILDTNDQPANNKNMKLTFGASINNSTPAGVYSADLSLIATGKF